MTWVLLAAVGLTVVALVILSRTTLMLRRRVSALEGRSVAVAASSQREMPSAVVGGDHAHSVDGVGREFLITQLGSEEVAAPAEPVPTMEARLFGDILLKEAVVQTASLAHGVRRALSAQTRNRIRFEMRREVKRSRKQRRADAREARRQWESRQRAGIPMEAEDPEDSAA